MRIRNISFGKGKKTDCALIFMDGMVNAEIINESIVKPLLIFDFDVFKNNSLEYIKNNVICANETECVSNLKTAVSSMLYGDSLLIVDGFPDIIVINTKGWRTRGISEPSDERVLQGPREGFDEAILLNIAMLRRKLPTPDLCVRLIKIGRKSDTKVYLCYLESLVNRKIVKKVEQGIKKFEIDAVLDSNYISELINKNKFSIFKTIGSTERPDIVAAKLLEGRVAVLVDGTPVALTIPYLFVENFQSDDDYYVNYLFAAVGRVLRYICFYLSILIPSLYLSLSTFHSELIPTSYLISISSARTGIPFSSFFECLVLIFVFEMLKETGIRIQQSSGHALSIVGGLVIGQAAVEAHIVSAGMLIVVALSGIAGLMLPKMKTAIFYTKIVFVLLSRLLGLFGLFVGWVILHIHLYSLNSFGVDYLYPSLKINKTNIKDTFFRTSWKNMIYRPKALSKNTRRLKFKK